MRNRIITITISVLSIVFVISFSIVIYVMFNFTPRMLGPAAITFWFVGVLVCLSSLITLIDYLFKLRIEEKRMQPNRIIIESLRTGFLIGFALTLLLALSSLKSLSIRDIILFALTVLLIELYFRTRKA